MFSDIRMEVESNDSVCQKIVSEFKRVETGQLAGLVYQAMLISRNGKRGKCISRIVESTGYGLAAHHV
ncbi:hypothetical protein AX774_g3302 [Zancudomyces culisetae]|nr:hypothetical protein AX774_g3302 [Zancudomyces culisetae]|eukprot:OMH83189.1 hypothetical protein AX774_g3302 [Zancudomyces culisetae]